MKIIILSVIKIVENKQCDMNMNLFIEFCYITNIFTFFLT